MNHKYQYIWCRLSFKNKLVRAQTVVVHVIVKVHTCCVFFSPEEEVISSQFGSWRTERRSWRSGSGGWTEKWHCALLRKDRLCSRCVLIISCFIHFVHCAMLFYSQRCKMFRRMWTWVVYVAAGYWFGIELDQPTGKHDGSVFGVRYFSCLPKYGVFAPPSRVQRCV